MDINKLPLEILQTILSYLSYNEQKIASLVCRRWHQASEMFIVRNGQFRIFEQEVPELEVIRNSIRNYQSFAISRMHVWEDLIKVASEWVNKFPNARELYLAGVLQDYLFKFYQTYRSWMEQLRSLEVGLDDRSEDFFVCGPENFILTLPNLKQLYWSECLFGHGEKTVTIEAPALENVHIDDSSDESAVLRIPHCERIKFISGTFYTKHFDDTFSGDYGNVEVLILNLVYDERGTTCLSRMRRLRYLALDFTGTMENLQGVDSIPSSKSLLVLRIRATYWDVVDCPLSLGKILSKFENLETLDIIDVILIATGEIQAKQLVVLNLKKIRKCFNSIISLNAPKLRTLSLDLNMLGNLRLGEHEHLSELYLNLGAYTLQQSFELVICPFLQKHQHVKNLILIRDTYGKTKVEDDYIHGHMVESVAHLELHRFNVSINFFQSLAEWKLLKSLKLVECIINCTEMPDAVVHLPGLERMSIDRVQLRNTSRIDFPIVLVNETNQEVNWDDEQRDFSTKLLRRKYNFYRPFCIPEMDFISCDAIM